MNKCTLPVDVSRTAKFCSHRQKQFSLTQRSRYGRLSMERLINAIAVVIVVVQSLRMSKASYRIWRALICTSNP